MILIGLEFTTKYTKRVTKYTRKDISDSYLVKIHH